MASTRIDTAPAALQLTSIDNRMILFAYIVPTQRRGTGFGDTEGATRLPRGPHHYRNINP